MQKGGEAACEQQRRCWRISHGADGGAKREAGRVKVSSAPTDRSTGLEDNGATRAIVARGGVYVRLSLWDDDRGRVYTIRGS